MKSSGKGENPMNAMVIVNEPLIRKLVVSILAGKGFNVKEIPACFRPEMLDDCSLECCSDLAAPHVLLAEVIPSRGPSAMDMAHKALRRWPGVKVLLTSATPNASWPANTARMFASFPSGSCAFLPKPFSASQLRSAVEDLIRLSRSVARGVTGSTPLARCGAPGIC